ncbi:MAG: Protein FdhD [Methanonatronarchaeales archaeon]|nr:Protein FdhD [Methanonatronarchaeales archaeon]
MRFTERFSVVGYGDCAGDGKAEVMREASVDFVVNGRRIASIMATPVELEELGVGYMVCEGLVGSVDQIESLEVEGGRVVAQVRDAERLDIWHELRSSGCVGIGWEGAPAEVEADTVFHREAVTGATPHYRSELYDRTRAAHTATLVDVDGEMVEKAVDVSRHNAYDKVIGKAVLGDRDLSRLFVLSTGRQSAGMVMKAARSGVPLVVTKTAPISSGVEAAEGSRVGLVCFASGSGFRVFANPWRVGL